MDGLSESSHVASLLLLGAGTRKLSFSELEVGHVQPLLNLAFFCASDFTIVPHLTSSMVV